MIPGIISSKKEGWNKAGSLSKKGTSEELALYLDDNVVRGNTIEVVVFCPE